MRLYNLVDSLDLSPVLRTISGSLVEGIARPNSQHTGLASPGLSGIETHGGVEPIKVGVARLSGMLALYAVCAAAGNDLTLAVEQEVDLFFGCVMVREVRAA